MEESSPTIKGFEAFSKGNQEWTRDLVVMYLKSTTEQLADLEKAVREADHRTAERIAHNAGGSSSFVGFIDLSSLFRKFEDTARRNDLGEAETILRMAHAEFDEIARHLNSYLDS